MSEGALSLTKHYVFRSLIQEIASIHPGMNADSVAATLQSPHHELYNDLFWYDEAGGVVDSVLMEVCRSGTPGAPRLVWVALVAADTRLQRLIEVLTDSNGRIVPERYSTDRIEAALPDITDSPGRKAASNIAHYFEQARVLVPERSGPQIVGVEGFLDTNSAVPLAVSHLADVYGWRRPLDEALRLGVNAWLNLTSEDFAAAWENPAEGETLVPGEAESFYEPGAELPPSELNQPYIDGNEDAGINFVGVPEFDPEVLERASRTHKATQNALANWVRGHGVNPVRPDGKPKFDCGWWKSDVFTVVEVKSIREGNEAHQVRLGLGQVLDYRKQLEEQGREVRAVLALSAAPSDSRWNSLCEYVDVTLTWPPFDNLDGP